MITNATESVADSSISNLQAKWKVLCVMALAPLRLVNMASRRGAARQRGCYSLSVSGAIKHSPAGISLGENRAR